MLWDEKTSRIRSGSITDAHLSVTASKFPFRTSLKKVPNSSARSSTSTPSCPSCSLMISATDFRNRSEEVFRVKRRGGLTGEEDASSSRDWAVMYPASDNSVAASETSRWHPEAATLLSEAGYITAQ